MQYLQQNTVALAPVCILMVLHDVHATKIFRNSLHFPTSLVSHIEQRISRSVGHVVRTLFNFVILVMLFLGGMGSTALHQHFRPNGIR